MSSQFSQTALLKARWNVFLAIICLALIPAWVYFFIPEQLKLPDELSTSTKVVSFDDFYNQATGLFNGEQQSATTFSYVATSSTGNILLVDSTFDVRTLTGEKIFAVTRTYGVDRTTGMHVAGFGDSDRSGFLFAPRMKGVGVSAPDKSDFEYWHINYNTPAHMEYRASEIIYGIETYRYGANFTADQTKELAGVLPGVGNDKGIVLDVHLELWVEPYTGRIIQYTDNADAFYYSLVDGKRLYPWNKFRNSTDTISAADMAKQVGLIKTKFLIVEFGVPIALLCLGVFILAFPYLRRILKLAVSGNAGLLGYLILPVVASASLVASSIGLSILFSGLILQQSNADFTSEAARLTTAIDRRLVVNADLLRGAQGLFNASNEVDSDEWAAYVESLSLNTNYPAILGLGFGKVVSEQHKAAFIKKAQEQIGPSYNIRPTGERGSYTPVYYIEPQNAANKSAVGFDMASEARRAAAMNLARDTGSVAMTGKIFLAQDANTTAQPAFIIYAPVYNPDHSYVELKDRQTHIYGFVYAALRMNNLMTAILALNPTNLGIEIFDGGQTENLTKERLLYKNDSVVQAPSFFKLNTITFYGHQWVVRFSAPATFHSDPVRRNIPTGIIVFGVLLSLAVGVVVYVVNTRRARAETLARSMTHDLLIETEKLQQKELELEEAQKIGKFGNFVWNINTNEVFWSDEAFAIHGWEASPSHTPPPMEKYLEAIHPEDRAGAKASIEKALASADENQYVYRVVWSDGGTHFIRVVSKIDTEAGGQTRLMKGTFQDVTKEMEIDKAKTEFVSLASHQLRTPLSAINWYTEMLLAGDAGSINDDQKKYLNEIYNGNHRMVELVNALLNVSRLDLGTFAVEPEPTNLIALAGSVTDEQRSTVAEKKINLVTNFDTKIPVIPLDKKLIRIVFQNLLSNAVKYTPNGGQVEFTLMLQKDEVLAKVSDTGYGIRKSQQDKIFTKLFRADNVREKDTEGTGLGLYLVKAIVEDAVEGRIWFESEENKGSTFFVTLPLKGMRRKLGNKDLS